MTNLSEQVLQPFSAPEQLPLYAIDSILAQQVLVVAPHPDDECLGCGGAIAQLSAQADLRVLVMTNGTMSHPNSQQYPAAKLQALREAETRQAMVSLGVRSEAITFLGLQDGDTPVGGAPFEQAVAQCCDYFSRTYQTYQINQPPDLIFLPWRADPHPDHRASWQIIDVALKRLNYSPRRIEYPIWDWDIAQRGRIPSAIKVWRLDIHSVVHQKQQAISLYRSQISDLINDDPAGFRLSPEMISRFSQPWEIYFEEVR